ncbi:hypothetical protein [Calycomorphotria hydatis]|uniref:Uncharacterized protein n=1 Tax=Calycomorphotria hydatis TaxID=2528027 RepID=A0A517T682_9PLAN|nr:hypothetical protein [Calycomorphotria hydatis]QDT63886.1 hypothetical protein V22_11120 [Calycomorphotria hydatis]
MWKFSALAFGMTLPLNACSLRFRHVAMLSVVTVQLCGVLLAAEQHIIYDYNRASDRHILLATLWEEDVLSSDTESETVKLKQLVRDASGGREKN